MAKIVTLDGNPYKVTMPEELTVGRIRAFHPERISDLLGSSCYLRYENEICVSPGAPQKMMPDDVVCWRPVLEPLDIALDKCAHDNPDFTRVEGLSFYVDGTAIPDIPGSPDLSRCAFGDTELGYELEWIWFSGRLFYAGMDGICPYVSVESLAQFLGIELKKD